MKGYGSKTLDGFLLQVLRAIEDIESENIREYQEKKRKELDDRI